MRGAGYFGGRNSRARDTDLAVLKTKDYIHLKKILLLPNKERDEGLLVSRRAETLLASLGFAPLLFPIDEGTDDGELEFISPEQFGLIIAFGGDGTVLRAAKLSFGTGIPVVGVNMGGKGFLAEIEVSELDRLAQIAAGEFLREERLVLEAELIREGTCLGKYWALNDAVIRGVSKVADISVFGDGHRILCVTGDGIVVATPTGSTAYSLSAGGPIVEPTSDNIIVTPICAHSIDAKSFILSSEREVSVVIGGRKTSDVLLTIDGQQIAPLLVGDSLCVRRSEKKTVFAHLAEKSFYSRVYEKLKDGRYSQLT